MQLCHLHSAQVLMQIGCKPHPAPLLLTKMNWGKPTLLAKRGKAQIICLGLSDILDCQNSNFQQLLCGAVA
jgi:hypothetical protein